jgi:hypothetical protein
LALTAGNYPVFCLHAQLDIRCLRPTLVPDIPNCAGFQDRADLSLQGERSKLARCKLGPEEVAFSDRASEATMG